MYILHRYQYFALIKYKWNSVIIILFIKLFYTYAKKKKEMPGLGKNLRTF